MTTADNIALNIADQVWLQNQTTQLKLQMLRELRQEKLTIASRQSQNPAVGDLQLRLLLREASVLEEVLNLIIGVNS